MNLREIDRLVAENIMGWTTQFGFVEIPSGRLKGPYWFDGGGRPVTTVYAWRPSVNLIAAWEIVEKLSDMDPQIIQFGEDDGSWSWCVDFSGTNDHRADPRRDGDIATAICLAALAAKGIEVPGD